MRTVTNKVRLVIPRVFFSDLCINNNMCGGDSHSESGVDVTSTQHAINYEPDKQVRKNTSNSLMNHRRVIGLEGSPLQQNTSKSKSSDSFQDQKSTNLLVHPFLLESSVKLGLQTNSVFGTKRRTLNA